MAGGREIVTKIRSVENTKKVTSALEMVSASKIRKSQDLMKRSRPYSRMMHRVIGHLGKPTRNTAIRLRSRIRTSRKSAIS